MDRFEIDLLLQEWTSIEEQISSVETKIVERASRTEKGKILNTIQILMTAPGVGHYTGLGLTSRIGPIDRFPRPRSLANYFGLTPSSRNSGETKERLGSITKEGSKFARFLLGQLVLHFLRKDPHMRKWYQRIKLRRGAKIAKGRRNAQDHHDLLAHVET